MDYLRWYRARAGAAGAQRPSRHRRAAARRRHGRARRSTLAGRRPRAWARRVVLATGRAGLGGPVAAGLGRGLAARRAGRIRPTTTTTPRLRGLRVGVVGAGASAMDSAATALEAGAARVHLLVRRADLPRINKGKGAGNPGFVQGYASLPDDWKWRIRHYINTQQVPPPRNSTLRVSRHANAHFHLGAAIGARRGARRRAAARHHGRAARARLPDLRHRLQGRLARSGRCCATSRRTSGCGRTATRRRPATDDAELAESPDLGAGVRVPAARRRALPGPRTRALLLLPGDALARRDHRRHPGDQRRRTASSPTGWRGCSTSRTSSITSRAWRPISEPEIFGDEWVAEPLPPPTLTSPCPIACPMNDSDVIDRAAGLAPGDPLHTRRGASAPRSSKRPRPATMRCSRSRCPACRSADRLRVAVHAAKPPARRASPRHYRDAAGRAASARSAPPSPALPDDAALRRDADHRPAPRRPRALVPLKRAGLGDAAIVALAQLVAFLSYQLRVVAGLKALRAAAETCNERRCLP